MHSRDWEGKGMFAHKQTSGQTVKNEIKFAKHNDTKWCVADKLLYA